MSSPTKSPLPPSPLTHHPKSPRSKGKHATFSSSHHLHTSDSISEPLSDAVVEKTKSESVISPSDGSETSDGETNDESLSNCQGDHDAQSLRSRTSSNASNVSTIVDLNKVSGHCFVFTTTDAREPTEMLIQLLVEAIGVQECCITLFNVTERPFLLSYMLEMQRKQVGDGLIESESKKVPQVFFNDFWVGGFQYILDRRDQIADLWALEHKRIDRELLRQLYGVYREQEALLYLSPSSLALVKPSPLTQYAQAWTAFTMLLKQKANGPAVIFRVRWIKKKRYAVEPSCGLLTTLKPAIKLQVTVREKIMDSYEEDFFEVDSLALEDMSQMQQEWTQENVSAEMEKRQGDVMVDLLTTSFFLEERKKVT